jgi:phytoene dehydrogenase-like protein
MTSGTDAVVVGAGLAGLTAAAHLHRAGLSVLVCEAGDGVGGRIRTDRTDGFLLDRGFQVILPAYPELRRQVELKALRLRWFLRGTIATTASGRAWLAAPWHGRRAAAGAAGFLAGRPRDAAALAAMSARDTLAPGRAVRSADPAATTLQDLRGRFSEATVDEVLRPFLAGVFLDPSLGTPPGCSTCSGGPSCGAAGRSPKPGCRRCPLSWPPGCQRAPCAPEPQWPPSPARGSGPRPARRSRPGP